MSRSLRKTPILGITTASTEKQDKRWANRRLRRINRVRIRKADEPARLREVSNVWDFKKDGKMYYLSPLAAWLRN
ncbi:hypothetical protein EXU85_23795 [Spirosoma sp. KCTC 42546]|uniref:hypothetical protein n=1 Tax=Spirosoma sp. KCTC 42546 TaxID=2520506 RepID=UPI00115B80C2|nr:hypothetical protein [Spirosoma sp. KCTC 42546]QDK81468.1 hypothetical protein EXU85_23795 [Spirosoma sp. KCTC 42546]